MFHSDIYRLATEMRADTHKILYAKFPLKFSDDSKNMNGSMNFSKTTYIKLNENAFSGFTDFIAGGLRQPWQSQRTQFCNFSLKMALNIITLKGKHDRMHTCKWHPGNISCMTYG